MNNTLKLLADIWSVNVFAEEELAEFANRQLIDETRDGLKFMSFLLLCLVMVALFIFNAMTMELGHHQNYFLVMMLAIHINISARSVMDIKTLHLLGMVLLIMSATAFVLVAHQTGRFNPLLIANIVLLFMAIPLIPWGLKEASMVVLSIYILLTLSTFSVAGRFDKESLWALQFFLLSAGVTSLALVLRGALLRKREIVSHFELTKAHADLYRQSNQDALTGAWNRRYLKTAYAELRKKFGRFYDDFHFVILDLDDFKLMNDLFGHEFGDDVLKMTCDAIREKLGEQGYLIRIGGDEFVILMVNDNPDPVIVNIVNTIKSRVRGKKQGAVFGMSWGMESASFQKPVDLEELYQKADKELYLNKHSNRIGKGHAPIRSSD